MNVDRQELERFIRGNLFDGQPGGRVTMSTDVLVNDIADVIYLFLDEVVLELQPHDYDRPTA